MAIVGSNLTSGSNASSATSFNTASITPTANAAVILTVTNAGASVPATINSVSGCNLTWTLIGSTHHPTSTTVGMDVYLGIGASPSTGAITFTFDNAAFPDWSVDQFTGVNSLSPIVQHVFNNGSGTQTGITATLSALSSSANAAYGASNWGAGMTVTSGASFTNLTSFTGSFFGYQNTEWAINQTAVNWTWASGSNWSLAVAVEIAAPSTGVKHHGTLSMMGVGS